VAHAFAADREYTAHTRDESVWVRVSGAGHVLGVQLEPGVMELRGPAIAERIQACADVAYLEGRLDERADLERIGRPQYALNFLPTHEDLAKARVRLMSL